jgi:hypothetical protein
LNVARKASDRFNEYAKDAIKPCAIAGRLSGIAMTAASDQKPQLLHLVFGGELKSLDRMEFANLDGLDIVGIYPNYAAAHAAWKGKGAAHGRQRPDALFHRSPAPPARSGRDGEKALGASWRGTAALASAAARC